MGLIHFIIEWCEPTALCVLLLAGAAVFRKRKRVARPLFLLAVAILLVCGNQWVSRTLIRHLENQYSPPNPVPQADCILILGGGIESRLPPRPTVEVDDAGDRVLYGAYLYRQGKAPVVVCTGGTHSGLPPEADSMAELLEMLGVPKEAIVKESRALTTRENAANVRPIFQERSFKRVLLVTSAMHMPRSVGALRRACPGLSITPAPTDFWAPDLPPEPWYAALSGFVPTARHLYDFTVVAHEYVGMAYYKLRGWI